VVGENQKQLVIGANGLIDLIVDLPPGLALLCSSPVKRDEIRKPSASALGKRE
jgi:hypothetical protein